MCQAVLAVQDGPAKTPCETTDDEVVRLQRQYDDTLGLRMNDL